MISSFSLFFIFIQPGETKGQLSFSLTHLPTAGRLNVVVLQAKDLRAEGESGKKDFPMSHSDHERRVGK